MSTSASRTSHLARKRKDPPASTVTTGDDGLCRFCQQIPAAVAVRLPHPRFPKRKTVTESYCLKHFYTTPAARLVATTTQTEDDEPVTIVNQAEFDLQLGPMQELFAEAFVQLQQDITQEAARAFTKQQHDPLAILHDLNPKKKAPPKRPRQMADPVPSSAGGFLPPVALPERLRRTQQAQQRQQQALTQRMERAAASQQSSSSTSSINPDLSRRRQSSRKSIWNMVRDESGGGNAPTKVNTAAAATAASLQSHGGDPELAGVTCGSCSSTQVVIVGSNSSRNQDLKKGETWGTKDRADEVFTRLQCQTCGRTWNEEL